MRRKNLTDAQVDALKPRDKRYSHPDPQMPGLYIRVTPAGSKSFYVVQKNKWTRVGSFPAWTVEKARERARQHLRGEAIDETVEEVIERYKQGHVRNLRSASDVRRYLDIILREFCGRSFSTIRRRELAALADKTVAQHGKRSAEYLTTTFSALSRWYAKRSDDYVPPLAPGMAGQYHGKARERILSDDELRAVWLIAEKNDDNFGVLVRLLLLTAAREAKVASMRWDDIRDGVWHIPSEDREKHHAGELMLPGAAIAIINSRPCMVSNPYVLAARDATHFSAFGRCKKIFDRECGVTGWTLHDLRRTARSLMSRAGVAPHVAERTLGHRPKGIEQVYDRFDYAEPKARALEALSRIIEQIVHPAPTSNVVPLRSP